MSDIKLYYNNIDIYNEVSVCALVHEMHAEKRADSLTIRFNDVHNLWAGWKPERGDQIQLKYSDDDSGVMYVNELNAVNGLFTIRALSTYNVQKIKKTRSWEGISLIMLISQIASELGLSYKCYGITNQIYKYISQENETNFEFLERICMYESCSFNVYNKSIVVYSEPYIESSSSGTIKVGINGVFDYDISGYVATGCTVTNGKISGTYAVSDEKIILKNAPATSKGEAERFARGILRSCNKNAVKGRITKSLCTNFSAGSILNLTTPKASLWDRKIFITCIRHDFVMNRSDIYFRECLEGY